MADAVADDSELDAIRARRMAELQAQLGGVRDCVGLTRMFTVLF